MVQNIAKGESAALDLGLRRIRASIGWTARREAGPEIDLDVSCFLLGKNGKVRDDSDVVFFNNPRSANGAVVYGGDNRTGLGKGDLENLAVDLAKLDADVKSVLFVVSIYRATLRAQHFGMIANSFIRLVDLDTNEEIVNFELSEDASGERSLLLGRLVRGQEGWEFEALARGFQFELDEIARRLGVNA